jgi:tRNA(Ile)-lysidine synthase
VNRLSQSVAAYIRKYDLLRPGDRVGIAVSAGADSVGLLRLTLDLREELGIVPSVVHLNHKLRGADSDADEQFVRELAETHGLEFIADNCDVKAYSAEKKLSLEAAAREVRYEFFRGTLQSGVTRIATAHTLDDQAETVLLKLARGAGTRGLAGIYPKVAISHQPSAVSPPEPKPKSTAPSSQLTIIRPLLGTRRSQLRSYLAEIGQSWREDASNEDLRHTRNRMRHEILPRLEQQVNPGVCEVLAETAEIARAEEAYWANEIARYLPQVWSQDKQGGILQLKFFASLPLALRRRLVKAAAETLGMSLEFRHVEEILDQHSDGNSSVLPGEWIVTRHGDELSFRKPSHPSSDYEYDLPVPGKITIVEAGIELETFVVNGAIETQRYNPQHLVDSRFAKAPLVVRTWRAGERFWPAHTKEPKKIKELLQDRHITGDEKRRWPVIASGDEIIWIRGLGVRRDFQSNGPTGVAIKEVAMPIGQE